jgi:thymidylate synthase (FAD)
MNGETLRHGNYVLREPAKRPLIIQGNGSESTVLASDQSRVQVQLRDEPQQDIAYVLDHGHVELCGHFGGDLSVVNGARVSFGKQVRHISDTDSKLIGFLMRERHGSPFEHNFFSFRVKAPIFVAREWVRHRIASWNEASGRYMELSGDFYVPDAENVRTRVGKPGNYAYEAIQEGMGSYFHDKVLRHGEYSYGLYKIALDAGIAPEQARMLLPVNLYTEWIWSVNARSLMNFLSLRNAPPAQWEIQQYAKAIERFFEKKMPITHQAFMANGRQAP